MAVLESGEQQALERLRATLYPGGKPRQPEPAPRRKFALVPKGKPMSCVKCGRLFSVGEFRVRYAVGWLCRHCYDLLSLADLAANCVWCKERIGIDDWRYRLVSVTRDDNGGFKRFYVHSGCEKELRRLPKAA